MNEVRCPFCVESWSYSDARQNERMAADHIRLQHSREWQRLANNVVMHDREKKLIFITVEGVTDDYYFRVQHKTADEIRRITPTFNKYDDYLVIDGQIRGQRTSDYGTIRMGDSRRRSIY